MSTARRHAPHLLHSCAEFSDWMAKIAMRFCVAYERLRNAKGRGSLWEAIDAVSL